MKLGIVIPLKARTVSRDWSVTCACLEQTLKSLEQQTSVDWAAVVVGHHKPDFLSRERYKTVFSSIEVAPPTAPEDGHRRVDWDWIRERARDRNRKIVRGMQLLREQGVDYWYYLDGDDLLHRQFVERLAETDLQSGAILDEGYLWYPGRRRIIPHSNMSQICGSTAILRASDFRIPQSLDVERLADVPYCRYTHMDMTRYFENEQGGNYARISDRLLAYSFGHGDNSSDGFRDTALKRLRAWAKPYLLGRRIDPRTSWNFSLA